MSSTNRKTRPKPTGDSRTYDKRAPSTRRAAIEQKKMNREITRTSRKSQRDFKAQLAIAKEPKT